ncbi:hypothetical protein D6B99_16285 [Arachidicoccus soli]|uniref:MarR family transcriptional regulator n=1 Tax=Arachidicoccus soli TaxID=2341117 RepID=A0A386HUQ7_9BACT|nr:hypothetical protein D6B99_16285 [Arachidicoccus soli]
MDYLINQCLSGLIPIDNQIRLSHSQFTCLQYIA